MARRGRPRAFDRETALRRAMQVFWAKTYDGTSMTDLTEAMGIASPSLYAAFGGKEALFCEAVRLYAAENGADIWNGLKEAPTIVEAVERFLMASAGVYASPGRPPGCLIVLGAQHETSQDNPAHRELADRRRRNHQTVLERFRRAIEEGELAPDFDAEGAAAFLIASQHGLSVLARDGANAAILKAAARAGASALGVWMNQNAEAKS